MSYISLLCLTVSDNWCLTRTQSR